MLAEYEKAIPGLERRSSRHVDRGRRLVAQTPPAADPKARPGNKNAKKKPAADIAACQHMPRTDKQNNQTATGRVHHEKEK